MEILFNNLDKLLDAPNGIEKARQLILQLAVQGKLTSKWRNSIFESHPELVSGSAKSVKLEDGTIYEPASELLKKIKEEKEKLIAEGKIKKQKELPPIKDEEKPFKLPRCWEWVRLGDSGLINPRNDIRDEIRVSFIPMALISDKYGESAKSETKSWVEVKKGFTHFAENDVGLAKITPCFENGKAAVFRNLTNGYGAGTTELHIFRRVENDMSSDYIYTY